MNSAIPEPSAIVHYVSYGVSSVGFLFWCVSPWIVGRPVCRARLLSGERGMYVKSTLDPVDCVTCMVVHGRVEPHRR